MSAADIEAATARLRSAILVAASDSEEPWCEELRRAWQHYTEVTAAPVQPTLEAIAAAIRAIPGAVYPMVCLGMSDGGRAHAWLSAHPGGHTTESGDGPRRTIAYWIRVHDVDFFAGYSAQVTP